MVDRTTRWPEAVPLVSTSASDISSDRGSQFTSKLWNAVACGLGVKLHRTTAYQPQAKGLCEHFHRSMKAELRAGLKDGNWVDKLPWVMLGLRTARKEDLQSSTAGRRQRSGFACRTPLRPLLRFPLLRFPLLNMVLTSSSGTMRTGVPCGLLTMDLSGFWNTGTNSLWSTWVVRPSTSRWTG